MWLITLLILASPVCQQEDSPNCYWDAQTRGNGEGTSFVDVNGTVLTTQYPNLWRSAS